MGLQSSSPAALQISAPSPVVVDIQLESVGLGDVTLVAYSHGGFVNLVAACVCPSIVVFSLERRVHTGGLVNVR